MTLDNPDDVVMGKEPVQDGERVLGYVTSAGMGFAVGRFILYAYLPSDYARSGTPDPGALLRPGAAGDGGSGAAG